MHPNDSQFTADFKTNDGQTIFYRVWKTNNNPKGIVLLVHGLNSHSQYFQKLALRLTENDFDVYALDLRGRGHSDGERYYINDYRDIIADINELLRIATAQPPLPIFLFGHSAGSVFASVYAILYQDKLQGLISESIAFQLPAPGFALNVIKLLAHLIPHARLIQLKNGDFSRDMAVVDAMTNDPLLVNEKQPAKTMQQLLLASALLKKEINRITLPLLLLHGTADRATKPSGSKYIMQHVSSIDRELKLYEGHYHDLLNDLDNEVVLNDIISWLTQRL
ncbi:lysophospholipase [Terrimonas sp. NA20]|uniref:Lysophospholipase n=1 Tax=Terrimonas ginsenosidimutans TaxID=2908004 RepID=A0ABS9KSD7_9BACT|nr:alpha/beta hydrolase [Terrimonas ginsenosidimutans]MCG2615180.1 lysophospholipase [Terrimonas ginsenosidimutans]